MSRKGKYTEEFKNTIIGIYKSCESVVGLNIEYSIPKSTISTWDKESSSVLSSEEDFMTLKKF